MNIETICEKVKVGKYIISFTHTEKIRIREIEVEEKEWESDWKTRKKGG
ncbi:MAG: hypothetical protein ACOYU0_08190 [Nitrospirota bacterium]